MHIFDLQQEALYLPLECKVVSAKVFGTEDKVKFQRVSGGVVLNTGRVENTVDHIVELTTK